MGKKKKKDKRNRNGDIQQIEDKQQRRTTRLGAIVAIIVGVGTVCTILLKMTREIINVWPQKGIIYWYMQILFIVTLSMGLIIFFDILVYVLFDLKRYNVLADEYRQYDTLSDEKYLYLLKDFKIYIIMLFIVYAMLIPLSTVYESTFQTLFTSVIILLTCIASCIGWIKKKSEEEIKENVKSILCCGAKCIIVSVLCYIVVASYITTNKATIEVVYTEKGCVEICNKSGNSYNGLDIQICTEDDKIIYTEHVEKKKLLFAREEEYISSKIDGGKNVQGVLIGSELFHWTYRLNLRQEVEKVGCYYIKIIVYQDGKSVELINSFIFKEDEFIYAKEHIIKDY